MDFLYERLLSLKGDEEMSAISVEKSDEVNPRQGSCAIAVTLRKEIEAGAEENRKSPSIWRVPPHLRKLDPEAYEPMVVSIGPLHREKKDLYLDKAHKLNVLRNVLKKPDLDLADYFEEVFKCLDQAKNEYSEKFDDLSDDEFAKLLVIDGCFVIGICIGLSPFTAEFGKLRSFDCRSPQRQSSLNQVVGGYALLWRDLLLFENQIPFFVVSKLYEKIAKLFPSVMDRSPDLTSLILKILGLNYSMCNKDGVKHILHLHHQILQEDVKGIRSQTYRGDPIIIPSAKELIEAGIIFQKKAPEEYKKTYQFQISFKDGTLEIPPVLMSDSTFSELRNFVAFEECCRGVPSNFTHYCVFLDELVDTPRDVAILRRSGILQYKIGSDAEVAKMLNGLCKNVLFDYDQFHYAKICEEVKKFSETPYHIWRANLVQNYFSSPWTTLSVMAAVLLLLLTCTQTFFSVFPRN